MGRNLMYDIFDKCDRSRCDNEATYSDKRLDMQFCSKKCADKEISDREFDYKQEMRTEHDITQAEIQSENLD